MSPFLRGTTRQQVAQAHAQIALQHDPNVLVATSLRTKSRHAREILAEVAWPGHEPAAIHAWAEQGSSPIIASGMDIPWLGRFAQIVALQAIEPDSFRLGRAVLERIAQADRLAELPAHIVELLLQLRLAARDRAAAEALLEDTSVRQAQRDAVEADLLNPRLFSGLPDDDRWLAAFNRALRSPDVAEVTLAPITPDDQVCVFDRLATVATESLESDRCITILMSCYRPGPALMTAVRSVIRQTWTNWELLIIDDASGPEHDAILKHAAQMDSRVRVIRKALNGGTYRARNTALRQAAGEFCTVVDSDDWIHPQALERHVQPLLERPGLMGTISRAVRVSEDLELNRPGTLPRVASAASLMFRTLPVLSRIGFFDTTSKGADTEFRRRLELACGSRVRELPQVLSILRTGETLSAAEISRGWKHSARRSYRKMYESWHDRIVTAGEDPFLDPDEGRRFPAPRRWGKPTTALLGPPAHVSICVAGDWSAERTARSMLATMRAALDDGRTVAVMHLDALALMTRRDLPLVQPVMELINTEAVEWIQPDDMVDVDDLVIHDPSVLQYPPSIGTPLRVSNVVIDVASSSPADGECGQMYCVDDVTERAAELFGVQPFWRGPMPTDAPPESATAGPAPEPTVAAVASPSSPAPQTGLPSDWPVVEVGGDSPGTATGIRVDLDEQVTDRYGVQRIPLRSLADAERHDDVVVAYRYGAEQGIVKWLQQLNDSHPAGARTQALLDNAPDEVVLVATSCDGLVQLSSRHSIRGETGGADLLAITGVDVPPSWSAAAWWASPRPRQIHLRHCTEGGPTAPEVALTTLPGETQGGD